MLLVPCLLIGGLARADTPPPYVISGPLDEARITIYSEYLSDPDGALTVDIASAATEPQCAADLGRNTSPWSQVQECGAGCSCAS